MLLEVNNLHCRRGDFEVLTDVSFAIEPGERISLVGANGAGKSTLLRCLLGMLDYSGEVVLQGAEAKEKLSLKQASRAEIAKQISWVPQAPERVPHFRVRDFVSMSRYVYRKSFVGLSSEDQEAVSVALDNTGTLPLQDRYVDCLSGGELRLVMLASALAQEPELILLDEPVSHLDPANEVALYQVIRGVNEILGKTIIMVGHEINGAAKHSHRIIALREGQLCFSGRPGEFLTTRVLKEVYGTDFRLVGDSNLSPPVAVAI